MWVLIALVVIVLVIFTAGSVGIISLTGMASSASLNLNTPSSSQNCRYIEIPYEGQEEYLRTEYYTETVPYTDRECETKNIAYSIDNFRMNSNRCNNIKEVCNRYFLGVCTDKTTFCIDRTVSCGLDIKNLDMAESGVFTGRFNFFERGSSYNIKSTDDSKFVYAQASNSLIGTVRITSEDESGHANREVSCNYVVINGPTKQVCRDVIKYTQIQNERHVTAYRPVTKYRSERICE